MGLKTLKIIDIFIIFILCFPFHFMYDWFPNTLFSIMFPVNESIWEHMKMIFSAFFAVGILDYLFTKGNKNAFPNMFITSLISIPAFLILYLPLYEIFGEEMFLNLAILLFTVIIVQIISYYILKTTETDNIVSISIVGIILVYILFGILTYYPLTNDIFHDSYNCKYGINMYDN